MKTTATIPPTTNTLPTIEEVLADPGLREAHCSWQSGYISRRSKGFVCAYKGRFGEGYTIHTPSWQSTRYSLITYYLRRA